MQCSEATIATESACYRKYYYLRLDYTEIIDFASSSPAHSLVTLDAHTTLLGIYPRVAAEMAVGHINERGVLPYCLKMITIETGCNPVESTYGLSQVLHEQPLSAILGPACETPAIILGGITSRNIGVVEVSYAAQSPLLSRVDEHLYCTSFIFLRQNDLCNNVIF